LAVCEAFEEENPNIRIKEVVVTHKEKVDKLLVQMRAGTPPDIAQGNERDLGTFLAYDFVEPLDDYIKRLAPDLPERFIGGWESAKYKNKLYGLSHLQFFLMMWGNNKIFADHGVSHPKNPDEFMEVIAKTTIGTEDFFGYVGSFEPGNYIIAVYKIQRWVPGWGSDIFAADGTPQLDDPRVIEAFEFFAKMMTSGYTPLGMEPSVAREMFRAGKAAMIAEGPWEYSFVQSKNPDIADQMEAFPIPTKNPKRVFASTTFNFIPKDAKHKDEAFRFLTFAFSPKWAKRYVEETGSDPGWKGAMDEWVKKPENAYYQPFNDFKKTAVFTHYYPVGLGENSVGAAKIVGDTIEDILFMGNPVEEAMAEGQAELEDLLGK
jgi:ABC-type glycerol-3-phosphate transport system substrate-binding protein